MSRFTAADARNVNSDELDERIEYAVRNRREGNSASLRIYREDSFFMSIRQELEDRGFKNIDVPDITLKGDVTFEWDEE